MKNYRNLCLVSVAIISVAFSSCKSSNEGENKSETGTVADEKTVIVTDTSSDYAILKAKTLNLVKTNEAEIAAFKSKLATETASNKVKFQKEIDSLNAKNVALKSTLSNYKEEGKAKLNTFKARLQKSIDDINKDIDTYRSEHK